MGVLAVAVTGAKHVIATVRKSTTENTPRITSRGAARVEEFTLPPRAPTHTLCDDIMECTYVTVPHKTSLPKRAPPNGAARSVRVRDCRREDSRNRELLVGDFSWISSK